LRRRLKNATQRHAGEGHPRRSRSHCTQHQQRLSLHAFPVSVCCPSRGHSPPTAPFRTSQPPYQITSVSSQMSSKSDRYLSHLTSSQQSILPTCLPSSFKKLYVRDSPRSCVGYSSVRESFFKRFFQRFQVARMKVPTVRPISLLHLPSIYLIVPVACRSRVHPPSS
jgi:hypothetical protein